MISESPSTRPRSLDRVACAICLLVFLLAAEWLTAADEARDADNEQAIEAPDVLVFHDGDRTRGRLIGRDGEFLVFHSLRFGELRVRSDTAEVVPAREEEPPVEAPVPAPEPEQLEPDDDLVFEPDVQPEEAEAPDRHRPHWTSPAALAITLRDFLGAWQGRFAVAVSVITKQREQRDLGFDFRVSRTWENDEARIETRYDLRKTEGVTTTDLMKGNGLWRHKLSKRYFVEYRPTVEVNRAYIDNGIPADYLLLQQEIGIGVQLYDRNDRKMRVGVAENIFDVWTLSNGGHSTQENQSLFAEIDLKLPWRISLTDRYVWYYSIASREQGWENRFELTKKFNDALSLGIRHEARRNNPDPRIEDYTLLRLQVGLDF